AASSDTAWSGRRRWAATSWHTPRASPSRRRRPEMAGGARQGDEETPITDINVTPLVDVVLVLLIILMVTATAIVKQKDIPVELPEAETGDAKQQEQPTTLAVSIDQEGQIYLDAEKITLEGLKTRARESREKDPETRAILNADARIPH